MSVIDDVPGSLSGRELFERLVASLAERLGWAERINGVRPL